MEFDEDTIMRVIDEIRNLHMTNYPTYIGSGHTRTGRRSKRWHANFNDDELLNPTLHRIVSIYEKVWKNEYPLVISHNDVNHTNIVCKDEIIYFIDWDTISMNDELFDVCKFLFLCKSGGFNVSNPTRYENGTQELYDSIEKYIEYYYGRKCTSAELKLAYEDIFCIETYFMYDIQMILNYRPELLQSIILRHGEQFICNMHADT